MQRLENIMASVINPARLIETTDSIKQKPSILTNKEADRLFAIYRRYLGKNSSDDFFMKKEFASVESCRFKWENLNVQMPIDAIEKIAEDQNVVQLRPVSPDAKILIVGCGNKPIANDAGYPLKFQQDLIYAEDHAHPGAITIDPFLAANPTLVGYFGSQQFPMIQNNQFDLIVIEATQIKDTPIGRKELERIASKTAQVLIDFGDHLGYPFSWELNATDCWAPDFQLPKNGIDLSKYPCFHSNKPKTQVI